LSVDPHAALAGELGIGKNQPVSPTAAPVSTSQTTDSPPPQTRELLLAAGERSFTERGYVGSRLTDIVAETGLTTGAFYRHFASKLDFFEVLFDTYGIALCAALDRAPTLGEQFQAWLTVAREHRGIVRASTEVVRHEPSVAAAFVALRAQSAQRLARHLRPGLSRKRADSASLMLVDTLDQYALMEAAGWTPARDVSVVAGTLTHLVRHGLYRQ
jgi:AcrR family transcriptional regulator